MPACVAAAAQHTLTWIRDYHLKYFLNKSAKINGPLASRILEDLVAEVG
jgi:hypothetical protein